MVYIEKGGMDHVCVKMYDDNGYLCVLCVLCDTMMLINQDKHKYYIRYSFRPFLFIVYVGVYFHVKPSFQRK